MNKGIYYTTQRLLSTLGHHNVQLPDSHPTFSLAQLIFSQESTSNSTSSFMRMCCCSVAC